MSDTGEKNISKRFVHNVWLTDISCWQEYSKVKWQNTGPSPGTGGAFAVDCNLNVWWIIATKVIPLLNFCPWLIFSWLISDMWCLQWTTDCLSRCSSLQQTDWHAGHWIFNWFNVYYSCLFCCWQCLLEEFSVQQPVHYLQTLTSSASASGLATNNNGYHAEIMLTALCVCL